MGPSKDTHGTFGPFRRKAVGGPINAPQGDVTHNDGALRRDKRQVSRQTWKRSSATIIWQVRSGTNAMSTLSTSRSGDVPNHQEDRAEERNHAPRRRSTRRTEYIQIPQNQYTDKVVKVTVVIQEQVSPDSNDAQTELEKKTDK